MEILKRGKTNLDNYLYFICEECGCEWIAKPEETLKITPVNQPSKTIYHMNCPCCGTCYIENVEV